MKIENYEFLALGRFIIVKDVIRLCIEKTPDLRSDPHYFGYKDFLYSEVLGFENQSEAMAYLKKYMESAFNMGTTLWDVTWKFQFVAAFDTAVELEQSIEFDNSVKSEGGAYKA